MITIALLSLAAQAPVAHATEPDIVVIGQRLNAVRVNVVRDPQGRLHCSLTGSSGNSLLDERVCRASANCVRRVGRSGQAAIERCIVEGKKSLLAQFRREQLRNRKR